MISSNIPIIKNKQEKTDIFWFRRDLRLQDNTGLYHALNGPNKIIPIFIFDRNILGELEDKKDRRLQFIHHSLHEVQKILKQKGSSLLVLHGEFEDIWKTLVERLHLETVYTNHDYEPYAIERDRRVSELLKKSGVQFKSFKDQVIFEKDEILKPDDTPYTVYTPYRKRWQETVSAEDLKSYPSEEMLDAMYPLQPKDLPSLESLGFRTTKEAFPPAEPDEQTIRQYHKYRDYPALDATTRLSVHLRFGTVSIRQMVRKGMEWNETWLGELIWREFFMMILYHFPHVVDQPFKSRYKTIKWRNNHDEFERWCEGETGYPLVDAGMRELNQTGFMHNRVRMV
jgi:deoxyribodipyrimidine photo-lyase